MIFISGEAALVKAAFSFDFEACYFSYILYLCVFVGMQWFSVWHNGVYEVARCFTSVAL